MILTKQKKEFAIKQAEKLIKSCNKYELTELTSIREFKWYFGGGFVYLSQRKSDKSWEIFKLQIRRNDIDLTIEYLPDVKQLMDDLYKSMLELVKSLDDRNFKKAFPEWDPVEERDAKLTEILGVPTVESPEKNTFKSRVLSQFKFF